MTNIARYHLYVKFKNKKQKKGEIHGYRVECYGQQGREMGRGWLKDTKFPL